LAEAEVAEADADLSRWRADADRLAASAATALRDRYADLATELVELADYLDRANDAVRAVNSALTSAGRSDAIEAVEDRAWPLRRGVNLTRPAFANHLSLPARGSFVGVGDGYYVAQLLGSVE
jgi:hypothetical protein